MLSFHFIVINSADDQSDERDFGVHGCAGYADQGSKTSKGYRPKR